MKKRIVGVPEMLDTSGGSGDLWQQMLPGKWRLDRKRWHDAEVVTVWLDHGRWFIDSRTHSKVEVTLDFVRHLLYHATAYQDAQYAV